jgi:hypothetical protein
MRLKSISQCVLLLWVCVGLASCNASSTPRAAAAPSAVVKQSADEFDQFAAAIRDHLNNDRFTLLDTTASQLRVSKERFAGGAWKLNAFYTGLDQPPSGDAADEGEWQVHLNKLNKWVKEAPDSLTARVGLGDALVNYAWKARGQGYADKVSGEAWRLFNARSALAERALDDAQKLEEKCPHWYVAKLSIGLGQGWEPARFEKVFKEGVALEPTYYYLYRVKAMYLLPRWYGEPGDWERFADETYHRVGGKDGAILYYMICSHLRTYYGLSLFDQNKISWPKMREGFMNLDLAYSANNERLNEACVLAAMAGDRETARDLFDRIGENCDLSVWRSKVNFEVYRNWAHHKSS